MKRLAIGFGALVLAIQIAGCGGDTSSRSSSAAPVARGSEDPNLPAEVREQFKREEERVKQKGPTRTPPKNAPTQ